jgi:hypothetical protein
MQEESEIAMQIDSSLPRLMNLNELADLWRVSPHTIRSWVQQKRLSPTKICRRLLFHPDECNRFLASGESDSPEDLTPIRETELAKVVDESGKSPAPSRAKQPAEPEAEGSRAKEERLRRERRRRNAPV